MSEPILLLRVDRDEEAMIRTLARQRQQLKMRWVCRVSPTNGAAAPSLYRVTNPDIADVVNTIQRQMRRVLEALREQVAEARYGEEPKEAAVQERGQFRSGEQAVECY